MHSSNLELEDVVSGRNYHATRDKAKAECRFIGFQWQSAEVKSQPPPEKRKLHQTAFSKSF